MPTQSDIATQLLAFGHAPIPYIAEAILVAMLVWFLSRSINKGVVDALRERLDLAIDRFRAANDEADTVRRNLEDLRRLLPSLSLNIEADAAASSAQASVRELVQSNSRAIAFLSGETQVTPMASSGPASKPEARR
jgi:hypothetical protein